MSTVYTRVSEAVVSMGVDLSSKVDDGIVLESFFFFGEGDVGERVGCTSGEISCGSMTAFGGRGASQMRSSLHKT